MSVVRQVGWCSGQGDEGKGVGVERKGRVWWEASLGRHDVEDEGRPDMIRAGGSCSKHTMPC